MLSLIAFSSLVTLGYAHSGHAASDTASGLPLPFGVEFEFIFPKWTETLTAEQRFTGAALALYQAGVPSEMFSDYYAAHHTSAWWKVAPDASLVGPVGGFEVVSPIMTGEERLLQVGKVLSGVSKFEAVLSEATDFHVHVDATGRSVNEVRNVLKNFIYFEEALDMIQPPNHQANNNPYMKSVAAHFASVKDAYEQLDACSTIECLRKLAQAAPTNEQAREHKLNLAPHGDAMSIEFRGHHGTLDSQTAMNWVRLTNLFVDGSFKGVVASADRSSSSKMTANQKLKQLLVLFAADPDQAQQLLSFYEARVKSIAAQVEAEGPTSILVRHVTSMEELQKQWEESARRARQAARITQKQRQHEAMKKQAKQFVAESTAAATLSGRASFKAAKSTKLSHS